MAPVVFQGKLLLRELIHGTINWDTPLPEQDLTIWDRWSSSLEELNNVKIPRLYLSSSFSACEQENVHVFFVMRRRKLLQLFDTCNVLFHIVAGASDLF